MEFSHKDWQGDRDLAQLLITTRILGLCACNDAQTQHHGQMHSVRPELVQSEVSYCAWMLMYETLR